jgi:protein-S-isoprenylcysteine O-methyltransferase Ste14
MADRPAVPARSRLHVADALARRRVSLGFVTAIAVVAFAQPAWTAWQAGLAVAAAGEAIRIWAAGHLEKGREVTRSGPYQWTGHPLYVGSSIMALGVALACRSVIVAAVIFVYMAATLTAAVRSEEAFLSRTFGDAYDRYRRSASEESRVSRGSRPRRRVCASCAADCAAPIISCLRGAGCTAPYRVRQTWVYPAEARRA